MGAVRVVSQVPVTGSVKGMVIERNGDIIRTTYLDSHILFAVVSLCKRFEKGAPIPRRIATAGRDRLLYGREESGFSGGTGVKDRPVLAQKYGKELPKLEKDWDLNGNACLAEHTPPANTTHPPEGLAGWERRKRTHLLLRTDKLLRELRNLDNQKGRETHKKHIDKVHIMWSEHNRDYRRDMLPTEFRDLLIMIYPPRKGLSQVTEIMKPDVPYVERNIFEKFTARIFIPISTQGYGRW
ncbi:tuberin [Culex quinquefasciatus]|uniref:Tuberin n=1 Tax=Culex quinquefasciatus TaxID=7176 RepID=B0WCN8_CULQU|nr:tuberin [Culex quinquefasciatus]|eukprot:XP_001846472.1 tuberin [Culex quinquefasciatus]